MFVETSIIIPIHNADQFLVETLESVIAQSYQSWEAILINDNSTDESLAIAKAFAKNDSRFIIIDKKKAEGAARARNEGIKVAQGRYISFLDSDDVWLPEKLEIQIDYMKENNIALSYSSYHFISEKGVVCGRVTPPENITYNQLLKGNVIACLTAVYDSEILGKVFMPDILKRQDFGLWLKITKPGITGYGIQQPLAKYRLREGSISSAKFNTMMYTWQLYREIEKLSFIKSLYCITNHLLGASFKRVKNLLIKKNNKPLE